MYDFFDHKSSTAFNQTFSAMTSNVCNNELRLTEPHLVLTQEVISRIKAA